MPNPSALLTLHALAAENAGGNGAAIDLGELRTAARLALEVTAISGSLTVTLEASADGATGWRAVDAWPAQTAVGQVVRAFVACSRYVRVSWAFGGGGQSATFAVSGEGHQVFFDQTDITAGALRPAALTNVGKHEIADAVLKGSDDILDALNSAYTPPIKAVGESVRRRGAALAAWAIVSGRGVQVDGPNDILAQAAGEAEDWLKRVSQGRLRPTGIVDSTPDTYEGGAVVVSGPSRGW